MNVALWVVQSVLALAMLASGIAKITMPKDKLAAQQPYVEDFSQTQINGIGALEALGAVGLIVPAFTKIAPALTPLAALGLLVLMLGAVATHLRRGEQNRVAPAAVLALLALVIVLGRFGPSPLA